MSKPVRLAVLRDFPEERWWSMELVADKLLEEVGKTADCGVVAEAVCPPFRARFARHDAGGGGFARNADRLLNRLWDYPRYVRHVVPSFDFFHLVDHSYSQLVHELPGQRTGVFCHDLDTFRCVLDQAADRRPLWFRAMARRILRGMQKAAVVFHTTSAVRNEIEAHQLIDPKKLVQAPYGVSPEFTPDGPDEMPGDGSEGSLLTPPKDLPFVLHVGSCIPRKRIDVLLDLFAGVRNRHPDLRLVQVGGEWTDVQRQRLEQLNLKASLIQIRRAPQRTIAWLYRRAALVLQPSDAEGFGLPVIEALACGANVVASDIPTLREVGANAATFCKVADIDGWVQTVDRLLRDPSQAPPKVLRLAQAAKYTWAEHARRIVEAYTRMA